MCFVWIWEQTAIISLYNINWLVCITETECVYCVVRTGSLYIIQFMCFVWIWEQTAIISLYSINWLVCITETGCVYCAVRTGSLYIIQVICFVWISDHTAPPYTINWFVLGAFANFQKANINCVTCVLPSFRIGRFGSRWTDYHEIWFWTIFGKLAEYFKFH